MTTFFCDRRLWSTKNNRQHDIKTIECGFLSEPDLKGVRGKHLPSATLADELDINEIIMMNNIIANIPYTRRII